jgi:hemoglobin
MTLLRFTLALLFATVLAMPTAFAQKGKGDPNSLYNRLGGQKSITAVVDKMVEFVAADDRINSFFQTTASDPKRMAKFKKNLSDQICMAAGGPQKYKGKSMPDAHKNMGVSDAHFGALVEDLIKALDFYKVPAKEKGELLGLLGPMKGDIVGK